MAVNYAATVTVTTSGTPVRASVAPVPVRRLYIQADPNNTVSNVVYMGGSGLTDVAAGDNAGYNLAPGEEQEIDFTDEAIGVIGDLSQWWFDASANSQKINLFGVRV